mgnify:CR=1 FL=1|tara:strand:+ start:10012 stop:10248 length:237 start_codon:yes stop_codon:yes gene_type:complete
MNYASMKKKIDLLKKYEQTRQNLFEHTSQFYDSMGYDIEGYWEEIENLDESDIKELEKKIKNFEVLAKCYAKIDFKYC